ncbi:hypothetical protein [Aestuariirhabdus sp. LZHN29]|uniref:hypothetical protein n=1 Tax=Aestuariirhabdus sp. LZHN29 TaxID=3417462 RepID=UPI003CE8834E
MNHQSTQKSLGLLLDIAPGCPQNCCTLSQMMVKKLQHRFGEHAVQDSCEGERVEDGLVCGDLCRIKLDHTDDGHTQVIDTIVHLTQSIQQQFQLQEQQFRVRLAGQAAPIA